LTFADQSGEQVLCSLDRIGGRFAAGTVFADFLCKRLGLRFAREKQSPTREKQSPKSDCAPAQRAQVRAQNPPPGWCGAPQGRRTGHDQGHRKNERRKMKMASPAKFRIR
jgi:hypothetical protein